MSDMQLESEITSLLNNSGYKKSKSMICPMIRIISMRHKNISIKQIDRAVKAVFQ